MNTETGQIYDGLTEQQLKEAMDLVEISESDMTPKQKKTKQVSKYDNRSKLGKVFTAHRQKKLTTEVENVGWHNLNRNQKRNLRRKLRGK